MSTNNRLHLFFSKKTMSSIDHLKDKIKKIETIFGTGLCEKKRNELLVVLEDAGKYENKLPLQVNNKFFDISDISTKSPVEII
jgi:hypothetical protein